MRGREISDTVRAAMMAVPRVWFLPEDLRPYAAEDRPLPIGMGQTNSQPSTVARMLTQLDARPGDHALDVGTGSGWTAALLAHLVEDETLVRGVELEPDLVAQARADLVAAGFAEVRIAQARPDVLGLPESGPYDKILVSAEARSLPDPLVQQLGEGGRLVIPVSSRMLVVDRLPGGRVDVRRLGYYSFVPLRWTERDE